LSGEGARRFELAISAFVGALALAVSTYNVYLQRAQIRAQVWAHLEWTYTDVKGFAWQLTNSGVGPAIVKGARVTVDGAPVTTWHEALVALAKTEPALGPLAREEAKDAGDVHMGMAHHVLGAGVQTEPLRISGELAPDLRDAMRRAFSRVRTQICYCSTLGECWMFPEETPVASCPMAELTFAE